MEEQKPLQDDPQQMKLDPYFWADLHMWLIRPVADSLSNLRHSMGSLCTHLTDRMCSDPKFDKEFNRLLALKPSKSASQKMRDFLEEDAVSDILTADTDRVTKLLILANAYVQSLLPNEDDPLGEISAQAPMIAAAAVDAYLQHWLLHTPSEGQNRSDFLSHPFVPKAGSDCGGSDYGDDAIRRYYRDADKFEHLTLARKHQTKETKENFYTPEDATIRSWIDLVGIEWMFNAPVTPIDMLLHYVVPFRNAKDRYEETPKQAYESLMALINQIWNLGNQEFAPMTLDQKRRYVCSCMFLSSLEEAERFLLVLKLVLESEKRHIPLDKTPKNEEWFHVIWGRCPCPKTMDGKPFSNGNLVLCNNRLLMYDKEIRWFFEGRQEERERTLARITLITNSTLCILLKLIPVSPNSEKKWTEADYDAAFKFYRAVYNLPEYFHDIKLPSPPEKRKKAGRPAKNENRLNYYKEIRKFYRKFLNYKKPDFSKI